MISHGHTTSEISQQSLGGLLGCNTDSSTSGPARQPYIQTLRVTWDPILIPCLDSLSYKTPILLSLHVQRFALKNRELWAALLHIKQFWKLFTSVQTPYMAVVQYRRDYNELQIYWMHVHLLAAGSVALKHKQLLLLVS